jgi:hypothetical protein
MNTGRHEGGQTLPGDRPSAHAAWCLPSDWTGRIADGRAYDSAHVVQGDAPRTDDETAFLARVRAPGWEWATLGLIPEDTNVLAVMVPLLVVVNLRHIPKGFNQLQVGYWPPDRCEPTLQAEWGDGYLLDNGGHSDELEVGPKLGPITAADQAAQWLRAQLQRSITRED